MDRYYKWKVLGVVVLIALSIWKFYPPQEKVHLGLDLKGGMHLLLRVELEKVPEEAREDAVERAVEVIRNRVDAFGVTEPSIQKQGTEHIVIQLPGITDRARALDLIGKTALLEFKLVANEPTLLEQALEGNVPEGYELKQIKDSQRPEDLLVEAKAVLTGDKLVNAAVSFDQTGFGQPVVSLEFDGDGAKAFARVTEQAVSKFRADGIARRLAIVLDGELRSAPQMRVVIADGRAQIEGNFAFDEASDLALVLRAGALPAPVKVEEDRVVGPSLGRDSIVQGTKACIISGLLVAVFMSSYYLLPGMIASLALTLMLLFIVGGLASFGAALTLPGIAGIVLNIGMAVDANVLIFERIREELNTGKAVRSAISAGYHKALSAIMDANVTTFISAIILFYFGTGPVKGFAVTLSIGIVASMLTAIVITRLVFDALTRGEKKMSFKMLNLLKQPPKFDFVGKRFAAYALSIIIIVAGLVVFVQRGNNNYGVDFVGGVLQQVRFEGPVELSDVRSKLSESGLENVSIQKFGEAGRHEVLFRSIETQPEAIQASLEGLVGAEGFEILRSETVGPAAGAAIRNKAIKAFMMAMFAIIMYIWWRFGFKFGLCAVIALFHDALMCLAALALTGRELSLPDIAAILAVMGYSLNDTIVVFDRLRENMKQMKRASMKELVNVTVSQTLTRTLLTSFTTLIVAVVLFLFGGSVINDFAFTLIIGVVAGTYSSIFIAASVLSDWQNGR